MALDQSVSFYQPRGNIMATRYRWDVLYDSMAGEIESHRKTSKQWGALSQEKGLTKSEYLAARLTQLAQQELDFSFRMKADWQFICHALTNFLESSDVDVSRVVASTHRCTIAEAIAGGCMKYIALGVDFMDYVEYRMFENVRPL